MVSVEGEKGGQLHPSTAQLSAHIPKEATCVDTVHGDAVDGHFDTHGNGDGHVVPGGEIVAAPVTGVLPGTSKGRTSDDERAFGAEFRQGNVGGVKDGMTKGIVHIVGDDTVGVRSIHCHCPFAKPVFHVVYLVRGVVEVPAVFLTRRRLCWRVTTAPVTLTRGLVQVYPNAIKVERLVQTGELTSPPICSCRVMEIGPDHGTGPMLTNVFRTVGVLDEHITLMATRIGSVFGSVRRRVVNASVDDGDKMLTVGVQSTKYYLALFGRKPIRVQTKVLIVVHVVNIDPHGFQWEVVLSKLVNAVLNDAPIMHSPGALMVAKSPVLLHGRKARHAVEVL